MHRTFYIILTLFLLFQHLAAQEVLVSSDINIRNNYSYDIVGEINDRIVLFRDAGSEYFLESFDEDMSMSLSTNIVFEKKNVNIYSVLGLDTTFQILYGYNVDDSIRVMSRRYNQKAVLIDSLNLFTTERKLFKDYRFVHSEDESKTLLYAPIKDNNIELHWIDNKRNQLISSQTHQLAVVEFNNDFRYIDIANNGLVVCYFDSDNYVYNKKDHLGHLFIFKPNSPNLEYAPLDFEGNLSVDMKMEYNNQNNHIVLAGMYSPSTLNAAEGYFLYNKNVNTIVANDKLNYTKIEKEFIDEIIGTKRRKSEQLNHFIIKDLILRADGGVLLFFESYKEFSRRSASRGYTRRDAAMYGDRGWVDYYNEDIIIISTHPDGRQHWKKVLHKKQFSQDDEAIFSSFYIFKTPSRLRLVYNDDITKNSTISEYLLDPVGKYERRSLLNTEYENLKLRFNDSLQLTSKSMIVPSQQSYTLNLVKITY